MPGPGTPPPAPASPATTTPKRAPARRGRPPPPRPPPAERLLERAPARPGADQPPRPPRTQPRYIGELTTRVGVAGGVPKHLVLQPLAAPHLAASQQGQPDTDVMREREI